MTEAPELVIEFDRLRAEGPLDHRHEKLLNIQADLRITVGGREWFSQPMFPVVELAAAADRWVSRGGDFVFETTEAEESPFMWVRDEAGGCMVGAAWQVFEERRPLSCEQVRDAWAGFVDHVVEDVRVRLGVDVRPLLFLNRL